MLWLPVAGVVVHFAAAVGAFLSAAGLTLAATPQRIRRLPTVEEAVRSMAYRGRSARGVMS